MRRLALLPLLAAVCMGVDLPPDGPVPASRPASSDVAPAATDEAAPTGEKEAAKQPATQATKNAREPDLPDITAPEPDEIALAHCEAELRKLGTVFNRQEPLRGENGCGIEAPYQVDQIVPGVSLTPASHIRCKTALALARWTDTVVLPATEALPDDVKLTGISHGSTYVCRRRNNSATGKMSEHAIGNAVDIMSFEFEGHDPIAVSPRAGDGTVEEAFQRAVRGGACLHFTTVLGPGSNASHANHLHLDVIKRKRGYRLCE